MKGLWRIQALINKYIRKWNQTRYLAARRSVGISVIGRLPWDYVQILVEYRLHDILQIPARQIQSIAIVGTCWGAEIPVMLKAYPSCQIHAFEPVPRYCVHLRHAFGMQKRVAVYEMALGSSVGKIKLWDTGLDGVQSIKEPQRDEFYRLYHKDPGEIKPIDVEIQTIDTVSWKPILRDCLDLLWIDVQGAEMEVLVGATDILKNTRAVFAEVALHGAGYKDGCSYRDIDEFLVSRDFDLVCCGLDSSNQTGNALWIRRKQ